MKTRRLKALKV